MEGATELSTWFHIAFDLLGAMASSLKLGVGLMLKRLVCFCVALTAALVVADESSAQSGVFGYPSGGCSTGACGHSVGGGHAGLGNGNFRSRLDATQAQNEKIYARNGAWPKPFSCADRQLFHNLWTPMFAAGWEDQNILTSTHFNEEGELTSYGKQQISSMLANMPQHNRTIFVQKTADPNRTQMRLATVQNIIQTSHPHRSGNVQASNRTPQTLAGWRAVDIIEKATSSAPNPRIPIASGNSGINSAVTGN